MIENVLTAPVEASEIEKYLPHRYPFLLLDRVVAMQLEPEKKIVAIKNVSINEPFFTGHFPGNPVMPGVLIIESMAQAAGMLANLDASMQGKTGELYYLVKVDKAKFSKTVVPGDQLVLEVTQQRILRRMGFYSCEAKVDGKRVACHVGDRAGRRDRSAVPGTAIVDALAAVAGSGRDAPIAGIVLLSDGRSNIGEASPDLGAQAAVAAGIKVYTIGIGAPGVSRAPFMAKDIFDVIQELRAGGSPFAIATVVETEGSVSAKTASKAVIDHQGRMVAGWVGGGVYITLDNSRLVGNEISGNSAARNVKLEKQRAEFRI